MNYVSGLFMENKNKEWIRFFVSEKLLFEWIRSNAVLLHQQSPMEYEIYYISDIGDVFDRPPQYIRAIYKLRTVDSSVHFLKLLETYKKNFLRAVGKDKFKNYPIRMANFYENIDQINLSTHHAYESVTLQEDKYFTIVRKLKSHLRDQPYQLENFIKKMEEYARDLDKIGIESVVSISKVSVGLSINTNDLFDYIKSKDIRARRLSGTHYRALVRKKHSSRGDRESFGLMILNSESRAEIYTSTPEESRPHKLQNIAQEIRLPNYEDFDYQLYSVAEPHDTVLV